MVKSFGSLFYRGILREECGYFVLRQSIPYPLGDSNSYIAETSQGWAIIDVGVDLPSTRELWQLALKEIGISFQNISEIYITHCHPDHLGAAKWMQQRSNAPVFMLDEEIKRADTFIFFDTDFAASYRKAIEDECRRQNFRDELRDALVHSWQHEVTPLFPKPEVLLPLHENQQIDLRGEKFTIIPAPVHVDGQFLLWNDNVNQLFCADLLAKDAYVHFTDWPNTRRPNSIELLFNCIERLKTMGTPVVFPGHGGSFNDLPARLQSLQDRHWHRLKKIREKIKGEITAADMYPQIYDLFDYVHLHRSAMGETLGYLEYLSYIGEIQKSDQEDRVIFSR
ncbi:MAG TPA: MBL fold metallo-hydrolase [Syntrophomonas sp.]|nr:MBL fold metallo-hydrolase [Syntrophomonas sp.]